MDKILIIEDEPKVADFLKRGLEENNFTAEIAFDGRIGKSLALNGTFSAIILDVNLPQINGFELCKILREAGVKVPVLMLTALGTLDDKLFGFESGADDYLQKPFEFKELLARLKALLKRSSGPAGQVLKDHIIRIADLEIDPDRKIVKRSGKKIELTAKEFVLLEYLARNKGRVLSRVAIAERVWDIDFDTGTNVIDVYINFLRKKVDKDFEKKLIHTQIGMGYVLKENED